MKKFLEFGRKVLFYVRVLSGYEERRIRNYRLMLEKRLQQAQQQKEAQKKIPEQIILSEVRRMVDEMRALNNKLEETEKAIDEYFKPLDREAESIMKMQLSRESTTITEMMKMAHTQALLGQVGSEKNAIKLMAEANRKNLKQEESIHNARGE